MSQAHPAVTVLFRAAEKSGGAPASADAMTKGVKNRVQLLQIDDKQFTKIKAISIFNNISEDDMHALLDHATLERYEADEIIFREKDRGSSLYIVLAGKVKIYRLLPDNTSHEITNFTENEFFGEMSFMDNEARSANAIALEPTLLINLTSDNFEKFTRIDERAAFRFHKNIISEIQGRLRRTNDRYSYHIIWGKTMKEALAKNYEELLQSNIELSENRNFLYNVLNNSTEIIIVLDPAEKIVIFNGGAEQSLRVKTVDVIDHRVDRFFPEGSYAELLATLRREKTIRNIETEMRSSDGKRLIVQLSAFILNHEKQVSTRFGDGIVIMARDITEKKLLERQLLQNEKMIFLGRKLSEIMHDVRNPMTIIQLSADCICMALSDAPPPEIDEHLKKIFSSVGRIGQIIDNTLDFSKVVPSSQGLIDLRGVITKSIELARASKHRRIETVFEPAKDLDLHIIGNAQQLEQVFINLITNAAQAIPEDRQGRIEICASQASGRLSVSVSDNGSGIPEEILANIFDPFFTTRSSTGGTGLGLSICQAIISQHEGTIECESHAGSGTIFRIALPLPPK